MWEKCVQRMRLEIGETFRWKHNDADRPIDMLFFVNRFVVSRLTNLTGTNLCVSITFLCFFLNLQTAYRVFSDYATSRSLESSASLWYDVDCKMEDRDAKEEEVRSEAMHLSDPPLAISSCILRWRSCSSRFCLRHLARRFLNQTWKERRQNCGLILFCKNEF